MTEIKTALTQVPHSVGAAARAVLDAHGDTCGIMRIFHHRHVPMVMVDGTRHYVEVNRPARLAFRFSLDEMRTFAIDDLTAPDSSEDLQRAWARLLDTGRVAGRHQVSRPDGSRLDVVYCGLASVLPGLHLAAFAPADWPEDELDLDDEGRAGPVWLTPQQIKVLALAAEGRTSAELAQELVVSRTTVKSHFKNIHSKLGVRTRCAAVAKAMRLGIID